MQTWAKRGVQAALVTGGMLAAGTGVASASENCPDRPAPPLGESAPPQGADILDDGTPRRNGLCFAGELFPADSPRSSAPGKHTVPALSGTIDPVTDVLPAVEDALTQELPRVTDHPATTGRHRSADAAETRELPVFGRDLTGDPSRGADHTATPLGPLLGETPSGRHAADPTSGSPAEGFQRSLSWSGAIGDVVLDARDVMAEPTVRNLAAPLVVPGVDPAVVEGFAADHTSSIVELWKASLGKTAPAEELPAALLSPRAVDLTSAGLPAAKLHTVPRSLLDSTLSTVPAARQDVQEFLPLHVPGDTQEQVTEVPNLPEAAALVSSPAPRTEDSGRSRITRVLENELLPVQRTDGPAAPPAFSDTPELSDVTVTTVDELATVLPERDQVVHNPFRQTTTARTAATGGMSLPVLDGGLPTVTVAQGETLPSALVPGTPVLEKLDTAALLRGVSDRS